MANKKSVYCPVDGKVICIEDVRDNIFSDKCLGDGFAIIPSDNKIFSPIDGTIVTVVDTLHAVGIESNNGDSYILHIGIDTVELKGEGFEQCCKKGQKVLARDLLIVADFDKIKEKGLYEEVILVNTSGKKFIFNNDRSDIKASDIVGFYEEIDD